MTVSRKKLCAIVKKMPQCKVLVLGDVMIDHFIWGSVERISPEAPVPVVKVVREETIPGGAANVARNLLALDAGTKLVGVMGDDEGSEFLRKKLEEGGIDPKFMAIEKGRPTTKKTRVIACNQQIVRFDREADNPILPQTRKKLLQRIENEVGDLDAVIVSDYAKGVVSRLLMNGVQKTAGRNRFMVSVDPKIRNAKAFNHVDLITPNHHEAGEMLGIRLVNEDKAVEVAGHKLLKKLNVRGLLITRAHLGMTVFTPKARPMHIPTVARQVYDVTGAGDSVIAAITLAKVAGASWEEAASIANFAAGVVVGKLGTATVSIKELYDAIKTREV